MTRSGTIVVADLVAYSEIVEALEGHLSAEAVADLNRQIQTQLDQALEATGLKRTNLFFDKNTGDGAMFGFDSADQAHQFAKSVHEICEAWNRDRKPKSAQRWFRIGAMTGQLSVGKINGKAEIAGTIIGGAVRLEGAARIGELVIDITTYNQLSEGNKVVYAPPEQIRGKREESFSARRAVFIHVEADAAPKITPDGVFDLFDRLNPPEQLGKLVLLIEMPAKFRPSERLSLAERQAAIVDWSANQAGGLLSLDRSLRKLIAGQMRNPR